MSEMKDGWLSGKTDVRDAMAAFTLFGVYIAAFGFVHAFVARQLWVWFVTPTFGVPTPRYAVMLGLILLVGEVMPDMPQPREQQEKPWWMFLARQALFLLMGYILHWLVIR